VVMRVVTAAMLERRVEVRAGVAAMLGGAFVDGVVMAIPMEEAWLGRDWM
jgi:hypothetical protein